MMWFQFFTVLLLSTALNSFAAEPAVPAKAEAHTRSSSASLILPKEFSGWQMQGILQTSKIRPRPIPRILRS